MDKLTVEKRVIDWKKRISDLYSLIQNWVANSDFILKEGPKSTMFEELMSEYDVPPTDIDTIDIIKNNKIVLAFKPRGLWVIGANGRIDILSNKGSYLLIDESEQFSPPKWNLFNGNKNKGIELNKESFLELLNK